jgi:hypothetical protein
MDVADGVPMALPNDAPGSKPAHHSLPSCVLAYTCTKFTRDSFRDLGAFWKRRDSRVNWVRFEAGRDSQREFTRLHRHITVTSSI